MSKLRSVNTHFWNDNYIIDLDPIEKLLFLYLLTNPNTNMLGVYELHIRKISFDTGIDKDMVQKIFDRFHEAGKASYVDGYVCLHNFTKHQSYNTNMKVSAVNSYHELPLTVQKQPFMEPLVKALEPLPEASEPIAEIEYEYERELEEETEIEAEPEKDLYTVDSDFEFSENYNIDYKSFIDFFNEVTGGQCRMTPNKKPDIKKQLKTFTGTEIKQALINRSKALKDSEYLTSWESIFTRKPERMEKYLNLKTSNLNSNGQSKGSKRAQQLRDIQEEWPE